MSIPASYTTLHLETISLASLTRDERDLFDRVDAEYHLKPPWVEFKMTWLVAVVEHYDRQNLPRIETVKAPLYRVTQDMGSRLMVAQGYARPSKKLGVKSERGDWKWFVTETAINQLLGIAGIPRSESEREKALEFLGQQSISAREIADDMKTGLMLLYRTAGKVMVGSRKTRLEFTVAVPLKREDLPQLVRVRDKGSDFGNRKLRRRQ
jgi:hypothetical protein